VLHPPLLLQPVGLPPLDVPQLLQPISYNTLKGEEKYGKKKGSRTGRGMLPTRKSLADKIYRIQITLFPTAAASTRTYSFALASLHRITHLFAGL
jgi:hypothetical protein